MAHLRQPRTLSTPVRYTSMRIDTHPNQASKEPNFSFSSPKVDNKKNQLKADFLQNKQVSVWEVMAAVVVVVSSTFLPV